MPSGHLWSSETGDTTKLESIDMEEECLVEKTSFDYDENGTIADGNHDQMPKEPDIKTKKALSKPLGKINFSINNIDDNVFLDASLELSPLLKNLVFVSVRKSFTLDIGLDKVVENFSQEKLMVVKKLFSKVNGFGEVSTPSKFSGIICASFISEFNLVQATKKTRAADILINTNLKKLNICSDRAVVVKKIPVGTLAEAVCAALSEFGSVMSIKMQLVGLWQKAVTDLVVARWFILIGKNAVRVAKTNVDKKLWDTRNQHKAFSVGGKTCVINCHFVTYTWARCAVVCFDSAASINAVMETTPVLKGAKLHWSHLSFAKCAKCENLGYMSLSCSMDGKTSLNKPTHRILSEDNKSRLASIYARCSAPIFYLINVVGGSSFPLFSVHNGSASSGFSLEKKPTLMVSIKLNDKFPTLKHSLASFTECVDKLAKRLDSPGPMNQEVDIVMSEGSGVVTGSKTIVEVAVFDSSVVSKMEETLNNLSITVMGLSAKIDNVKLIWRFATCNVWGLNVSVKQKDVFCWHRKSSNMMSIVMETKLRSNVRLWIMNKFDGVCIFTSGLNNGFLGAGIAIVMNNSLAQYVSKVEEVPGHIILVHLIFKDKVSVSIVGLYACASSGNWFG
ncbi:hypothetical protein G9A89_006307 [Geosiphon pyriformis]|nr:hypothetical protein G9A89_006307 [Geosiphon pyriformis]